MLELDGVAKRYGSFRLGPIDLSVGEEVLAVLGPSGCGKTTLLSVVAGVVTADEGRVRLDGDDVTDRPPEARDASLVFQDGALFPHMTARENVAYAADAPGRVDDLAERLGIADVLDQNAATLSGGQRQRVALARSLAADPDALLLDEPLANLDEPERRRLRDEMADVLGSLAVPVIYVTHDQRQATGIGDRIAVMEDGEVHQVDTPTAVFERPATPFVASFTGAANVFRATAVETAEGIAVEWGDHRLPVSGGAAPGETVWCCIRPEYVEITAAGAGIPGRIVRRTFEGEGYRLTVALDGGESVEASVLAPRYDRLDLDGREAVAVRLPPDAIHLMDAP